MLRYTKVARKMAIVNPGKASPSLKSESQGSYIEKASKKDEDLRVMFANKEIQNSLTFLKVSTKTVGCSPSSNIFD